MTALTVARPPQRIQRRRTHGWTMPPGATYVGRPTKWGNPFRVGATITRRSPLWPYVTSMAGSAILNVPARSTSTTPLHPDQVVALYGWWIIEQPPLMLSLGELTGRDLACWRPLGDEAGTGRAPCHVDVLLGLANPELVADDD